MNISSDSNACLICGKAAKSRGLCNTHYSEWNRQLKALPKAQHVEFESLCIKAGRLLPSRHTGKRTQGAFDDIIAKMNANAQADSDAAEIESKKTKATKKAGKKKAQ